MKDWREWFKYMEHGGMNGGLLPDSVICPFWENMYLMFKARMEDEGKENVE